MGSTISDEQRKEYEEHIKKYPPLTDEEAYIIPEHLIDVERFESRLMQKLLDGKI